MNDTIPYSASDFYETPNLEILAKKGMVFSNAYASAPVCAPSRYSIQFGQTPARLQMIRVGMNTNHIDHNNTMTLAKEIKKQILYIKQLILENGEWIVIPKLWDMIKAMVQQKIKMVILIIILGNYNGEII